jgi:FkbM family methyltransferase
MITSTIRGALKGLGLYQRFRESLPYDLYRWRKDGRPVDWRRREVAFYRALLGPGRGALIFDVGVNRGQRTDVFLALGARVVAVEPDGASAGFLARKYRSREVNLVNKAAGDSVGTAELWEHEPGSGLNTLSEKWVRTLDMNPGKLGSRVAFPARRQVETTTLDALIGQFGCPRYIKVDVEGHEPGVLRGLTQPVDFLSFEANLPEFLPEAAECARRLASLSSLGRFNWVVDCHRGFALSEWVGENELAEALSGLGEKSVEVFWRTATSSAERARSASAP